MSDTLNMSMSISYRDKYSKLPTSVNTIIGKSIVRLMTWSWVCLKISENKKVLALKKLLLISEQQSFLRNSYVFRRWQKVVYTNPLANAINDKLLIYESPSLNVIKFPQIISQKNNSIHDYIDALHSLSSSMKENRINNKEVPVRDTNYKAENQDTPDLGARYRKAKLADQHLSAVPLRRLNLNLSSINQNL